MSESGNIKIFDIYGRFDVTFNLIPRPVREKSFLKRGIDRNRCDTPSVPFLTFMIQNPKKQVYSPEETFANKTKITITQLEILV